MLLRRLYHDQLAQASYIVACQRTKEAVVVDPLRDPAPYLEAAKADGFRITYVTETHVHADFLSGAAALATAASAELLLSGEGGGPAAYRRDAFPAARWLGAGDEIRVGAVRLDVLHVPGHTPEHIAFLVTDEATSDAPVGLLSGDFIFVGDVGRPDLLERAVGVQGTMEKSARDLHASLARTRDLPDFLQLWPGHGAGSACGKALGALPQSTLGYERHASWAFAPQEVDQFVATVLAGQPEPPAYFARMKQSNASGVPPLATPSSRSAAELAEAVHRGALVVDMRPATNFATGHLAGAVNVPNGKSFLGWAGAVLPPDRDLVLLVADSEGHAAQHGARDLALIGFDRVLGVLTTAEAGPLSATLPSVAAASLGAHAPASATLVDVRDASEWRDGHVPGARHIPLSQLAARMEELRDAGPLLVHCQGGSRSAVAASLLQANGFADVANVAGGFAAWERAGHTPERNG